VNQNMKNWVLITIGVVGYCVWAFMASLDATLRPDFLAMNIGMVTGTIGLVLRDMQSASGIKPADIAAIVTALSPPAATAAFVDVPVVQPVKENVP